MNYFNELKKKINNKKITIEVIGLGYVGLPLVFLYLKKFNVIGFDKDTQKLKDLKKGKSYLSLYQDQYLKKL